MLGSEEIAKALGWEYPCCIWEITGKCECLEWLKIGNQKCCLGRSWLYWGVSLFLREGWKAQTEESLDKFFFFFFFFQITLNAVLRGRAGSERPFRCENVRETAFNFLTEQPEEQRCHLLRWGILREKQIVTEWDVRFINTFVLTIVSMQSSKDTR